MVSIESYILPTVQNQGNKRVYSINGKELGTEKALIEIYRAKGYKVIWAELSYWSMLTSILYWDIIFAKVYGATPRSYPGDSDFDHEFNRFIAMNGMPYDLFTEAFSINRSDLIKNRFIALKNSNLVDYALKAFRANKGKKIRTVENWDLYSESDFLIPVQTLSKDTILKVTYRIINNFAENRAGLPDLIVVKDEDIRWIEVKSENDSISDDQLEWIKLLSLDLKQNIEIALINPTKSKVEKFNSYFWFQKSQLTIKIIKSSSESFINAIQLMKELSSYSISDDGNEVHSVEIQLLDVATIYPIFEHISKLRSKKLLIDGEEVKYSTIKYALDQYTEANERWDFNNYDPEYNPHGAGSGVYFPVLERFELKGYGYIDLESGDFIIDRAKIESDSENIIKENKYNFYFNPSFIQKRLKKIPERINLKKDADWAYVTTDYNLWRFKNSKWISTNYDTDFPGYSAMAGIKKIDQNDAELFRDSETYLKELTNDSKVVASYSKINSSKKFKKKGFVNGCLSICLSIFIVWPIKLCWMIFVAIVKGIWKAIFK